MSRQVIILKGLPASGKSTYAKGLLDQDPGRYKRINKDDLRAMLDNSYWSKGNEKFILKVRNWLIVSALDEGKSVIVDDTNLHPKHEKVIREIVQQYNQDNATDIQVKVKFFEIEIEVAIKRDLNRLNSVGERVIRQMYYQFLAPKEFNRLEQDSSLPSAVIVDIAGTIANTQARNPFDYSKVLEDSPIVETVEIVKVLKASGYKIIFVSGREDICREDTVAWLNLHQISFDELFMRRQGDHRKDSVIKKEIFTNCIQNKYCIKFVLDDRKQVKRMWVHELGLFVFDVNQGDIEF